MKVGFFPGFEPALQPVQASAPARRRQPATPAGSLPARPWDSFAFRARQFTCGLTRAQREAIARRPRFYSMPWVRPAGEPDLSDELP